MPRKRNELMTLFPKMSAEQASAALRKSGGDLDGAAAMLMTEQQLQQQQQQQQQHGSDDNKDASEKPQESSAAASISTSPSSGKSAITKEKETSTTIAAATTMEKEQLQFVVPKKKKSITNDKDNEDDNNDEKPIDRHRQLQQLQQRRPPKTVVAVNNLSDRQYCCVWWVEEIKDGYRPDQARSLLAQVARHANLILRDRGWRVKRLIESTSTRFLGCCYSNGRGDADAASANIMLNLRQRPDKHCRQFRTFDQVMEVMIHEVTHISIGLEDIHPPAFWELMDECRQEYWQKLAAGDLAQETDDFGCLETYISGSGHVSTMEESARELSYQQHAGRQVGHEEEATSWCGAKKQRNVRRRGGGGNNKKRTMVQAVGIKAAEQQQERRPLKKGVKMIDKRTKFGKAKMADQANLGRRELAARAALERLQQVEQEQQQGGNDNEDKAGDNAASSSDDDDDELQMFQEFIQDHASTCGCRCCEWDKLLCRPATGPS